MADRTTLVRYVTSDLKKATDEINTWGGAVTIRLSNVVLVASMPPNFNANILSSSTATPPNTLDDNSHAMLTHWQVVQDSGLLKPQPKRRISLARRGLAAVALVMESDITSSVFPLVLAGAHTLAQNYAAEGVSTKLTLLFKPYTVSSTVIPGKGPPNVPSQVGVAAAIMVPSTHISSWPSAITFNKKLFCFYRGHNANARNSLFYKQFDGSSWTAELQVPNAITSQGPSSVVFNNKLYCFKQGRDNKFELWYSSFDGSMWDDAVQVPNTRMTAGPSVVAFNNKLYCFHQGWTNPDNVLWFNVFDGQTWEGDMIVNGSLITGSPSTVVFNNLIYCFYQGAGSTAKVLMVRVLTPSTGMWSEPKPVSNSKRMSQAPSVVVVGDKLYCFHQDESEGKLYANVSSDGVEWGQDTLVENESLCEGLATANFNNELYYFYQKGEGGKVTDGELWYRKLRLAVGGNVDWETSQGEPSLKELGYEEGYKGYIRLETDMQIQNSANYGYVVYVTKSALLFNAYADETRMCLQYKEPSSIHYSFAKMFSAQGTFDQGLLNSSSTYPPRPVSQVVPRYTLAWVLDWNYVLSNATLVIFYRANNPVNNPHLWVLFLDKRNYRWVEMEGPKMSFRYAPWSGAPAPQFGPGSKLYVFYHADVNNQEMRYNMLGISNEMGNKIWDVEKVMIGISGSNTPSPISVGQYMHVFHVGPNAGEEFRYTSLDTQVNHWAEDQFAYRLWSGGSPSAVHYMGRIYAFHKGLGTHNDAKIAFSIWDKDNLTWEKASNNAASTHNVNGEPAAVALGDFVYVFYTSDGPSIWWNRFDGVAWRGPTRVDMAYYDVKPMDGGVAAYAWDDKIHCFFRGRDLGTDGRIVFYKVFNTVDLTWNDEIILPTAAGFSSKPGVILNHLLMGS